MLAVYFFFFLQLGIFCGSIHTEAVPLPPLAHHFLSLREIVAGGLSNGQSLSSFQDREEGTLWPNVVGGLIP